MKRLLSRLVGTCLAAGLLQGAARPNVILVMSDDQGYGDVACLGNTMIHTPNLDRLHGQSVRLTNFHVDPTCSPTRSALMTGHYSTRAGVWHTIAGRSLLYADEVTMADVFAAAGYATGVFGKWHLGDNYPMRPQDRGFQEVLVLGGGGIGQTPDYWGNDYFDDTYWHNGRLEKEMGYCTDVFFDHALKFIDNRRDRPFFLYLPTNVAHGPFNVADSYSKPYRDRGVPATMANFYGMIDNLDENVGRLLTHLEQVGLAENTILIFMTDNGTAAGVANPNRQQTAGGNAPTWTGFNAGMRGQKGSQYEGGHRVPCFWRWPAGGIGGGKDVGRLAAHFDLLPTLIELCGLSKPPGVHFDGRSLAPLLKGQEAGWPDRTLFVSVQRQELPPKWVRSAAMTDRWRLVNGEELYDLPADPGQQADVAAKHPEVVASLRAAYEDWWSDMQPAMARYARIVVGAPEANPTSLTCHDWHSDQVPWNQGAIRSAPWANGWWAIEVARPGTYEFTLRQQPAEAAFPIQATQARVRVGEAETAASVPAGATSVTLTLDLQPGSARLETSFTDEEAGKSRGAFYIDINRKD
ncbi:MAG: arylsulfatase [Verrucomicrobiales bacterium]|nr:arylsulfatase [Verrucomicrobiales bacterium]